MFLENEGFVIPQKIKLSKDFSYELLSTEKRMVHDELIPDSFLADVGKLKIYYKKQLVTEREFVTSDFMLAKKQFNFKNFKVFKLGKILLIYGDFVCTLQNNFEGYDMKYPIREIIDE